MCKLPIVVTAAVSACSAISGPSAIRKPAIRRWVKTDLKCSH